MKIEFTTKTDEQKTKKLSIRRETLRQLTARDLSRVAGGGSRTIGCDRQTQ